MPPGELGTGTWLARCLCSRQVRSLGPKFPPQFEPVVVRPRPDTLITEAFAHAAMALRPLWKMMLHALL